ncbi:TPA: hypothetical protein ACYU3E_002786, partial [Enterobacter ludwigii]
SKGSFFDWHSPVFCPQWRYVLLFEVYCSDIAHILENSWSYVLLVMSLILSGKGFTPLLTTKIQHEVIRVILITYV